MTPNTAPPDALDGETTRTTRLMAITGAAGNLGGLLAGHMLAATGVPLRLLYHRRPVPDDLCRQGRAQAVPCDLAEPATLMPALAGAECVIHFAGVLFKARPERFLPTTNTAYFRNLLAAAVRQRVRRVILISFPHVEGETTPEHPATGRLEGRPTSAHARTRLEEERLLFDAARSHGIEAVSLRVGMVYGRGILMVDAARWLAQRGLLAVWRQPTWIHLISKPDFVAAVRSAALRAGISGIYHIGDEGRQTLQEFLDTCAIAWGTRRPWRLPLPLIYTAAGVCELQSGLLGTVSPLTRDFVTIGRTSYYGDTTRMRRELLPTLQYPDLTTGKVLL